MSSASDFRPAWPPDGRSVAYVAYAETDEDAGNSGVFVIGGDGAGKRRVSYETVSYVLWSPDGGKLLLQSANVARLIDLTGQKQVLLSAEAGLRNIVNANFTPDGRRVMFCSNDSGDWRIYSIGLGDQKRKTITIRTSSSNYCLSPLLTHR